MEEAHRIHKDVSFGWLQSLRDLLSAMERRHAEAMRAPWRTPEEPRNEILDNLHHLSAPR